MDKLKQLLSQVNNSPKRIFYNEMKTQLKLYLVY